MTKSVAMLLVAAGRGARARQASGDLAKQYVPLQGRSVLERTIVSCLESDRISSLTPVIHQDDFAAFQKVVEALAPALSDRLAPVVFGGPDRQASVYLGLKAMSLNPPDAVLIHDGVRPFVSKDLISSVITALESHEAVVPTLPIVETLKRVEGERVLETVDRAGLQSAQTPQGFSFQAILAAHETASQVKKPAFTDDASIAEWAGLDVYVITGSSTNLKITLADDFKKAEQILSLSSPLTGIPRMGTGFDVHAFEPGDEVILCGISIPFDQALKGHSDADVGMHAITDAIYGALGAGDIGDHFPPTDPQWRGASSDQFLRHAVALVANQGGRIGNIDLTLICEAPKIGPYREAMRASLAAITDLDISQISVKATTSEQLGFTGRGEGIAALASAVVIC